MQGPQLTQSSIIWCMMRRQREGLDPRILDYADPNVVEPDRQPKPRGYSGQLEELVYECLQKEPNHRPRLTGPNNLMDRIRRNIDILRMDMQHWQILPPNLQNSQQGRYPYRLQLKEDLFAIGNRMPRGHFPP